MPIPPIHPPPSPVSQAAKLGINVDVNRQWAQQQIDCLLGSTGRSFVVGFGTNPPQRPHHRAR